MAVLVVVAAAPLSEAGAEAAISTQIAKLSPPQHQHTTMMLQLPTDLARMLPWVELAHLRPSSRLRRTLAQVLPMQRPMTKEQLALLLPMAGARVQPWEKELAHMLPWAM